jgi:hypothetical protein
VFAKKNHANAKNAKQKFLSKNASHPDQRHLAVVKMKKNETFF